MLKLLSSAVLVLAGIAGVPHFSASSVVPPRARAIEAMHVPAQQQGICCCQVFVQRWQYSWMAPSACAQARGTCVSPDHCG